MPFTKPAIAPETKEQKDAFDTLDDMLGDGEPSSAVTWAIKLQSIMGSKKELRSMKKQLRGSFQGHSCHNWTFLTLSKGGKNIKIIN